MTASDGAQTLPELRIPAGLTLAGLAAGLVLGLVAQRADWTPQVLAVAAPLGQLWLRALQMTILPLVCSLLFLGVGQVAGTLRGGRLARRTLAAFALVLLGGSVLAVTLTPLLLRRYPVPDAAVQALSGTGAEAPKALPGLADFLQSLVPQNVFAAAASDAVLPLILFVALLALASRQLPEDQRRVLDGLFRALAGAMLVIVGWVLRIAPLGVFALALGLAALSGATALGALAHYVGAVSLIGVLILLLAYGVALLGARLGPLAFARAVFPAQAMAISTQSSLACLPAMLAVSKRLGVSEGTADFVLPLAVALFRATSPAMNLAVAIYVASLSGVELTPAVLATGLGVAMITTLGAPSLPGSISFISSIGPIALAMGVPIAPLALLVAVEMLPDIFRTLGNVTMDVAVTAALDRD